MHIHSDCVAGAQHTHTHEHTHDGVTHTHEHSHDDAAHTHTHEHSHDCDGHCHDCGGDCTHTPLEELTALMQYMVKHNTAHANELAQLAQKLREIGQSAACEQVLAAVSDFEKGTLRLSAVLAALDVK